MKLEQITAWALDETSTEERRQLEAELREDPTAQKTAEDTKAFCDFLLAELKDESLALTDTQRERLKLAAVKGAERPRIAPMGEEIPKTPERKKTRWTTGVGVRLALAACLAVGCVVAWQQYDAKSRQELAARTETAESAPPQYKIQMNSGGATSGKGVPAPADPTRRAVVESVSGQTVQASSGVQWKTPPQVGIPALAAAPMPGAPSSVLTGSGTLTTGDVAELKRLQDSASYGLVFDASEKNHVLSPGGVVASLGAAGRENEIRRFDGTLKVDSGVLTATATPGGGIVAQNQALNSLTLGQDLGKTGSVTLTSTLQNNGGLLAGSDAPATMMMGGWGDAPISNTRRITFTGAAGKLGLGGDNRADFNGMTHPSSGLVSAAAASSPAVVQLSAAAIQAESFNPPSILGGLVKQGTGGWNLGDTRLAAPGSSAVADASLTVAASPVVGLVVDAGTPVTINGGWAGPPSMAGAPLAGGSINAGSLTFASSAAAPASPAVVMDGDTSTSQVRFGKTANTSGSLTTTAAGVGGRSQVDGVHQGLLLANSSVELGNYDTAISQYQDVVRQDPYNAAARRGMEEAKKKRNAYFQAAYDHQRAKMLAQVDEPWQDKVPVTTNAGGPAVIADQTATGTLESFNLVSPISNPAPDTRYFSTATTPVTPQSEPKPQTKPEGPMSESYQSIVENELKDVAREPLSTFSIDVDTAAYANVRRFLNQGAIPPADAVRIEELINYFPAAEEGPAPGAKEPFGVRVEMAPCPWQPQNRLARIAIKGRELGKERKASNLVFLVDVSGSMDEPAKLPLVQQSLRMLTEQLGEGDRVSMVVYAGSSGLALPPTNGEDKPAILAAIDKLKAGGSTHGSAGIQLAYEQAVASFIKDGVNRVILCTDGDFNVGVNSPEELEKLISKKAKSGVFLSVLGFGTGNLKDRTMETLADKGNGNYAYIDSLSEARKVLVEQMGSTLVTIAKDVKIQVEFNPAAVRSYRLVGYENRLMAKEDFNDDTKDAGEIGAGHSVVALYEIVPANLPPGAEPRPLVDNLRYQRNAPSIPPAQLAEAAKSGEVMTVKLRYKEPDSSLSKLIEVPAKDEGKTLTASTEEFKFSAAVAGFGLLLRDSAYKGTLGWETVRKLALDGKGGDKLGYRGEFLQLIDKARGLKETRQ